ncbi:MAG: carboxylate--amine ligase [Chloroflexota bacterium]|nr:carboxylate--amine ligase [Chloroflexota bacterium]
MTGAPVLVLKTVRGAFQHGELGVVRSLGRLGAQVHVCQDSRLTPVARSRYVRGTLTWNFPVHSEQESVAYLLEMAGQIGGRPILIPTDDVGALLVADHAAALKQEFVFPDQPPGLTRALASKKELFLLCKKVGVPAPETAFPSSKLDVEAFLERATFPVVVKAIDARFIPWHRGGLSVFIARGPRELLDYYTRVEQPHRPNLMLQEYIPGGPDSIWMFDGYFNADSECLIGFTGQKIRQYPPYTGPTSLGICVPNEFVDRAARDFLKKVGYRGIVDLGFRYDRRDGSYRLLDVNPRIGATFRLFTDRHGLDVAAALYLDLTGQPVQVASGRPGRRWWVENTDIMASVQYMRDGVLSFGEWVRSFRCVEESAWFASDDPLPFALMCGGFPLKMIRASVRSYFHRRRRPAIEHAGQ